jgi:hypothetical protein
MSATAPAATTAIPAWLDLVRRKVEALRFGQVYIVVHDHQVTQIECLEKTRLAARTAPRGEPEPDSARA